MKAEAALIGALIIDPEAIAAVAEVVRVEDIAHPRLRPIYAAALALHARGVPPDYVLLCAELEATGAMADVGGDWVLTRLINACPTSLHAGHYAAAVAAAAARRSTTPRAGEVGIAV